MRPTYLRLFSLEVMIEPTPYTGLSYVKDSNAEREIQLGNVRVLISKAPASANKVVWERF